MLCPTTKDLLIERHLHTLVRVSLSRSLLGLRTPPNVSHFAPLLTQWWHFPLVSKHHGHVSAIPPIRPSHVAGHQHLQNIKATIAPSSPVSTLEVLVKAPCSLHLGELHALEWCPAE